MKFVYFMKDKSQALEKFLVFKNYAENQCGERIKKFRSDNGGEFLNSRFIEKLEEFGIHRQVTVPYTPQQNGVAEC